MADFEEFLSNHPAYRAALGSMEEQNRLLAIAAAVVYETNGDVLGPVADEILSYVDRHYPANYVAMYLARVEQLQEMDKQFASNPSAATLARRR